MANEELIALLQNLQGSGAESVLNPGLLAQLPSLIAAAAEPKQAASVVRGSTVASPGTASVSSSGTASTNSPGIASGIASAASSAAASVASSALRSAGGGLTLLPVVTSLLKLFGVGRKDEAELPALEKFELPTPIRAEAGLSQSGETFLIDRGVGDRIRQLPTPAGLTSFAGNQFAGTQFAANQPGSTPPAAGASITVNVQAMDSQSFMDRREDIARAVREAMLQSHSLNDVVSEL
ncbi:MAG: hypothetical protein ACKV2U_31120 [Bryobacteraceae bacterium]